MFLTIIMSLVIGLESRCARGIASESLCKTLEVCMQGPFTEIDDAATLEFCKNLVPFYRCCFSYNDEKAGLKMQHAVSQNDDVPVVDASVMARVKIGLFGGFLGLSSIGTGIILLKYLYARARVATDDNNFSTMRRVSRARSTIPDRDQLVGLQETYQMTLRRGSVAPQTPIRRASIAPQRRPTRTQSIAPTNTQMIGLKNMQKNRRTSLMAH